MENKPDRKYLLEKKHFFILVKYLLIPFFFHSVVVFSQAKLGSITGTVSDSISGDPLIGANLTIVGTSFGAATDINGKFSIKGIQPGEYKLKISYIGYNGKEVNFKLLDGKTVLMNFELKPATIEGEEVLITAQAQGQNEAINIQIQSIPIKNVVSSAKIRELPDENAAATLARVPGISVSREGGEANKIRIRGVDQNIFYVNGIRMTGNNLAAISTGMIGGMEVQKSFTPDYDADVTGGVVSLKMIGAPTGFHGDLWLRPGYNSLSKSYNMFYGMLTLSNRFFDDKLGAIFSFTYDKKDRSADVFGSGFRNISGGSSSEGLLPTQISDFNITLSDLVNDRIGTSLYADYLIGDGKLYLQSFFGYISGENQSFVNSYSPFGTYTLQYHSITEQRNKKTFLNGIGGEHNLFGGKIEWSISYSQENDDVPERIDLNASNGPGIKNATSLDTTSTIQDVYNLAVHDINATQLDFINVFKEENLQKELSAILDFNFPFNLSNDISGYVKFGGKARNIRREYVLTNNQSGFIFDWVDGTPIALQRLPDFGWERTTKGYLGLASFMNKEINVRDYSLVNADIFFNSDFDKLHKYVDATIDTYLPRFSYEKDNYKGDQEFYAGYLMTGVKLGSRIDFTPGVRYEYNMYKVTGIVLQTQEDGGPIELQGVKNEVTKDDIGREWFPMAQFKYKITDYSDIRLAYSTTVSRPDPRLKSPKYWSSPYANVIKGNIELRPQTNYNYDISASLYTNNVGLFNISLFYKKITDQVLNRAVRILKPKDFGLPDSYLGKSWTEPVNNKWPGFVKGIELDWQTHFWYLPGFLDGLLLNINLTLMDSETQYPFYHVERVYVGPPLYYSQIGKDSSRVNTIIGMPETIANASLGYEKGGFSGRFSVYYQGATIQNAQANNKSLDESKDDLLRFDLQLSQKLFNDNLILYWLVNNISNWPDSESLTYFPEFLSEQQNYGWTTEIGFRYKL